MVDQLKKFRQAEVSETDLLALQNAHVLVIEDNVGNFALTARMLRAMGVQRFEWKTSGWQVAQSMVTLPTVNLVLLDLHLPYEDGYQVLRNLREGAGLKDVPVCAVTAHVSNHEMEKARDAGFDGFIAKPLDLDRFPDQICALLRGEGVWDLGISSRYPASASPAAGVARTNIELKTSRLVAGKPNPDLEETQEFEEPEPVTLRPDSKRETARKETRAAPETLNPEVPAAQPAYVKRAAFKKRG